MASIFFCFIVLCTITFWSTPLQGREIETGIALRGQDSQSHHVVAQKNSRLLLNCSVVTETQHGPLNYIWKKDGKILVPDRRVQVIENGSLFFKKVLQRRKNIRKNDEGVYECLVRNKVGTIIARQIKLEIAGINKNYDLQPEPQNAVVGGVARFRCTISASPSPIYTWWKNDNQQVISNDRYIIIPSGILQILNIQNSDEGNYNCMAMPGDLHEHDNIGDFGFKESKEAFLNVTSNNLKRPPTLVAGPSNVTAGIGQSAIFECLVDGNPKPTVEWTRQDGVPIPNSNSVIIGGMNLKLTDIKIEDEGLYVCTVSSPGHARVIAKASLIVQSPPKIQEGPTSQASPPSMNTRFKCVVSGSPSFKTQWLKDGKEIKESRTYKIIKNDLVILGSEPKDSGYYQCVAENPAGYATAFARYKVEEKAGAPSAPKGLTVEVLSSREAFVQWESAEAEPCCPVIAYSLEIQEINNPTAVSKKAIGSASTSKHIRELRPYTNYSISLTAFSEDRGPSSRSEVVVFRTEEDVPEVAPRILLASTTPTSIMVKWDEIPEKQRNGVITGYKIHYKKWNGTTVKIETEPGNSRTHLITKLEPQVTYKVRVLAGTEVGYSTLGDKHWPWMEYTTPRLNDTLGNVAPPMMHLVVINDTAVEVSWQQTDNRYPVSSYTLVLKKLVESNSSRVVTVLPPTTKYVFSKLKNNVFYEVSLTSRSKFGSSVPVTEEFDIPPESGPPTPTNLRVTLSTAKSMNLEWTQTQSSVAVTHYEVRFHVYNPKVKSPAYIRVRSNSTSVLIENLRPYTNYLFEVCAFSRYGRGKFSNSIIERTREDVPTAPRNVKVKSKPRAIIIEWTPPAMTHGNITEYLVMYQSDGSTTWKTKSVNGSRTMVIIEGLSANGYYIKLSACTAAGQGPSTEKQSVKLAPVDNLEGTTDQPNIFEDQKLGIIVGITIGVVCVIICILIIMLRNKCFSSNYPPHVQPPHHHNNGNIPGHGNGMVRMGNGQDMHEMESYTPMLRMLPENHHLDSKGCGSGNLIVTTNGNRINGYVPFKSGMRNGHIPNGHVTTFITNPHQSEETRGLLAAMLAASDGSYTSEDQARSSSNQEQGSLDDINKSTEENRSGRLSPSDQDEISNKSDLPPPPPSPSMVRVGDFVSKGGGRDGDTSVDGDVTLQQGFPPPTHSAHSEINTTCTGTEQTPSVPATQTKNSSCANQHSTSFKPSHNSGDKVPHHPLGDTSRTHLYSQPNNLIVGNSSPSLSGEKINQCYRPQGDIDHHLLRGHNQKNLPPPYLGQSPPFHNSRRSDNSPLVNGRGGNHHLTKSPQDILNGKMCSHGSQNIKV